MIHEGRCHGHRPRTDLFRALCADALIQVKNRRSRLARYIDAGDTIAGQSPATNVLRYILNLEVSQRDNIRRCHELSSVRHKAAGRDRRKRRSYGTPAGTKAMP